MDTIESKRRRIDPPGEDGSPAVDRISDLPDDILCTIISHLPIGAAVRTSILSRRWRHLHESIQCINFDIDQVLAMEEIHAGGRCTNCADAERTRHRIDNCVLGFDQLIRRLPPDKSIQSFRIHICSTETHLLGHIAPWIRFAIQRRVRELHIDLGGTHPVYGFPAHILVEGSKAPVLRQLSIRNCNLLRGSDFSGFSSLTSLNLWDVDLTRDEHLTHEFLSHCHNLEELSIRDCTGFPKMRGPTPKLKISLQLKHLKVFCPRLELEVVCANNLVSFECSEPMYLILNNAVPTKTTTQFSRLGGVWRGQMYAPLHTNSLNIGSLTVPGPHHLGGEGFNLLSELVLHRMDLRIERIGNMLANCPNLEQLRLGECVMWSKTNVYRLRIAGLVRLRHLEVCDCSGMKMVQVCASGLTTFVFLFLSKKPRSFDLLDSSGNVFCSATGTVSPLKYLHLRSAEFPVSLQNFGSVTTITLEKVHLEAENVRDILLDCSLLERLSITNCGGLFLLGIVGSSLKLKYLKVSKCEDLKDLKISAEKLALFEYDGNAINFSFIEAPELVQVEMNITQGSDHQCMVHVLNALTNLPQLHTLLLYIDQAQIPTSLPLFRSLKHLDLCIGRAHVDICDFSWVDYLLMASPLLRKIQLKLSLCWYESNDRGWEPLARGTHDQLRKVELWRFGGIKKEMLSRYLRNDTEEGQLIGGIHKHLEEIQVFGFRGIMKDFVIRLMHNAKALKFMKINPRPSFRSSQEEWDAEIPVYWVKHGRLRTRSQLARHVPPGVELVIQ